MRWRRPALPAPFQVREFIQQAWFIASVTILPAALVSIPFGAVIALQLGSLIRQLGAQSFTGAASVLAVVREASPIVTALLIAGAGGSAICADLGARKIREEIDAMEVLGINPIQRLVVPRVPPRCSWPCCSTAWSASSASPAATSSTWSCRAARPGAYLASFQRARRSCRTWSPASSRRSSSAVAALVAAYQGMNAKGGPKGVGDAVNQSVVITFMLLFALNFVLTAIYFQVVPQKGQLMALSD